MDEQIDLIEYKKLFNNKDNLYVHNLVTNNLLLEENKDFLIQPFKLSFLIENNTTGMILQNFIQRFFEKPWYSNNIIIENNSNVVDEQIKVNLSRVPFQSLVAESEYPFIDFITEISLREWIEKNYNIIHGFYLNIDIMPKIATGLVYYNYITPFIIKNDKIIILKKNEILKKSLFAVIHPLPRKTTITGLFISGPTNIINDQLIIILKSALNIKQSEEELKKMFDNNETFIRGQNRSPTFSTILSNIKPEIENKNYLITNIITEIYYTISLEKQKEFLLDLFNNSFKLIKIVINDIIEAINENKKSQYFEKSNSHKLSISRNNILKKINQSNNYYYIKNKDNYLFDFICKNNDIIFGTNVLIIDSKKKLNLNKCFSTIDEYHKKMELVINEFFKEIENVYKQKQKFII